MVYAVVDGPAVKHRADGKGELLYDVRAYHFSMAAS